MKGAYTISLGRRVHRARRRLNDTIATHSPDAAEIQLAADELARVQYSARRLMTA